MLRLMHNHKCLWFLSECLHRDPTANCLNLTIREYFTNFGHICHPDRCCSQIVVKPKCYYTKKKQAWKKSRAYNNKLFVKDIMSDIERPEQTHASCRGEFKVSPQLSDDEHGTNVFCKQLPSNFRLWESVSEKSKSGNISSSMFKFKVISYNVLAQYLLECHPYLYTGCPTRSLKWKHRAPLLFDEIVKLAPDILCLQEVQANHIPTFYSQFEELGYRSVFKQKTGFRHDGCAIFYKHAMFDIKDHISVEFYQPDLPILNRDNIGVMIKLTPKVPGSKSFVVATTHLLYNPKRTDVRLAQMQLFLAEIDRFCCQNNGRGAERLPVILTGDFNSLPDSAVIKLLSNGYVSTEKFRDSSDWRKIAVTDNCQHLGVYLNRMEGIFTTDINSLKIQHTEKLCVDEDASDKTDAAVYEYNSMFNTGHITHDLSLKSIYNHWRPDGEYEATTFQEAWVNVDYLYYSAEGGLTPLERYRLPTNRECQVLGSLPNDVLGSDHLALGAVFKFDTTRCSL